MTDPYQTLGLQRGASDDELARAYKKLAMQFHPDRNPGDKAAEDRFKEINAARDAIRTGAADAHPAPGPGGPWQFNFSNMGGMSGSLDEIMAALHAQQHRRNRDINAECAISLEEAFRGTEITVNLRSPNGVRTLAVRVPAGVEQGNRVRVSQAGEDTFAAMSPGDLFLTVRIHPHPRFARQGTALHTVVDVGVFDLLLGAKVVVQGIDGARLDVTVPADFDPASQLRVAGQGMPSADGGTRGDLLVGVRPCFPRLSDAQRQLVGQARAMA